MFNKEYSYLDISRIHPNLNQPRKVFDKEKILELGQSIKENGLIQPIVVKQDGRNTYQIIAGERRYRACLAVGIKKVACIIKDIKEEQSDYLAIIENIQRENLNIIEEAKAYQTILKSYQLNQTDLAKKVGKSQGSIANKIRLLKLKDDVQLALSNNQITERHARAMLGLDSNTQVDILRQVLKNKLNVSQTESLIKNLDKKENKVIKKPNKIKKTLSNNMKIVLNTINQATKLISNSGVELKQVQEETEDAYIIKIVVKK